MASVVRPEFRPTLPELLEPWWRRRSYAARAALLAAGAAVVIGLAAWLIAGRGDGQRHGAVRGPVSATLRWPPALHRVPPRAGELLRLQTAAGAGSPQSFVVRPLRIPAYRGDVSAELAYLASRVVASMQRTIPGFAERQEGRARIADQPGYQILYQARIGGRTVYGRRIMLVPDVPSPRSGADIELRAARSPQVPNVDSIGGSGALKTPLRSFHFGG
jgi:hypothetical protein